MYLLQSHQIPNLKSGSVITIHQGHIVGVRCLRWYHLRKPFSKHSFDQSPERWRYR